MSRQGKPSTTSNTPQAAAQAMQLRTAEWITWNRLLDLAVAAYWTRRP